MGGWHEDLARDCISQEDYERLVHDRAAVISLSDVITISNFPNYLAAVLILIGYAMIVYLWPHGFIVQGLGCIIYIARYWKVDWSIVITNSVFLIINAIGLYKWTVT